MVTLIVGIFCNACLVAFAFVFTVIYVCEVGCLSYWNFTAFKIIISNNNFKKKITILIQFNPTKGNVWKAYPKEND